MKKNVIVFGLISGIIVSASMAIMIFKVYDEPEHTMGTTSMVIGFLSMLIAFSLIFVAVKNYRDNENNGVISFKKAFRIGILITFIASSMYVLTWGYIYHYHMPDFMEIYSKQMIKTAEASGNANDLQAKIQEMDHYKEMYKNPVYFALITYTEILPIGILVTLAAAFILKRKTAPVFQES